METLWQSLVRGSSDFMLYAVLPTVVVNLTWFLSGLFCLGLDAVPALRKYKIQEHDNGTVEFWRCIRHSLRNKLISEIPLTFASYPFFVWLGVSKELPLPSATTVVLSLLFCLVVEDAWHYFAHRMLHIRWAMDNIHYLHHHYMTPFGMASSYAHPAETIFTGFRQPAGQVVAASDKAVRGEALAGHDLIGGKAGPCLPAAAQFRADLAAEQELVALGQ